MIRQLILAAAVGFALVYSVTPSPAGGSHANSVKIIHVQNPKAVLDRLYKERAERRRDKKIERLENRLEAMESRLSESRRKLREKSRKN